VIQLRIRIVLTNPSLTPPDHTRVAKEQHVAVLPPTSDDPAQPDSGFALATPPIAVNSDQVWDIHPGAEHLWRSPHGIWYVRLVVPQWVRLAHPNLPSEIRRSTKTSVKRFALARSKEICLDFFTRFGKRGIPMFNAGKEENGFSVAYINGALKIESSAGATYETLTLLKQSVNVIVQMVGRGIAANAPSLLPSDGSAPAASDSSGANKHMSASSSLPASPIQVASPVPAPDVVWLEDAIQEWRHKSGVKFSQQTWDSSYEPSFRILRELVSTGRRTVKGESGTVDMLDIPVRDLTRQSITSLHDQLKLLPPRQGKRSDGIEAPVRIAEAKANGLPSPSAGSVLKKLTHIAPCIVWLQRKDYISPEVLKEFQLAMEAAAGKVSTAKGKQVRGSGYVALSTKELKATFEQPGFRVGAIKNDWGYWAPLLCLYKGLRISEATQLHTADICYVDGVPCLRTATIPEDDDGAVLGMSLTTADDYMRRLKTAASRRTIPIHPRLIELGFLDFVSQVRGTSSESRHLFPTLTWHKKSLWGRKASDHIGQLIRSAGAYVFRKKVPHSLRSNFGQAVQKTGLDDALIQRLLGHSTGSMKDEHYSEAEYGAAVPAALAVSHLAKVDFGISVPSWADIVAWRKQPGRP
jgi:integrase